MSEFKFKELGDYLLTLSKDKAKNKFASVYLIYGEELLYKKALDILLSAVLPDTSSRALNYESFEDTDKNIYEIAEKLNTFSLMPGEKVIVVCDSRIFYSKHDTESILKKAEEAYVNNKIKKAAEYVVSVLGLLNLSFEDVCKSDGEAKLKLNNNTLNENKWLDKVITYCINERFTILDVEDNEKVLQKAVEKGFPKGNHLIITTDRVDKRRGLYKAINNNGIIIDCSVPGGQTRSDKIAQEAFIKEMMRNILAKAGKAVDTNAYLAMYEMTGFDLRTFVNNLEKLISFVGDRKKITIEDVRNVLKRTKSDPIYELTNAISDRNTQDALFFLNSLLSSEFHYLQIFTAITNQIRKLLIVKEFIESPYGREWHAGIQYNKFRSSIMPAIQEHDSVLLQQLEDWENMISKDDASNKKKKGKSKKSKLNTDLLIAKTPNNPYPVFQLFSKSERFAKEELLNFIEYMSKADLRLKSTGQNPKLVLEDVIFHICQKSRG
jgi:DNA polymerase-3 subunit delta